MQRAAWQQISARLFSVLRSWMTWTGVGLAGVLAVYMSLACIYALGVPHLRSYDEPGHVSYALLMVLFAGGLVMAVGATLMAAPPASPAE